MLLRTFLRTGGLILALLFCVQNSTFSAPQKHIALTFDDGPEPAVLARLLPLLEKYKVPATFFVIGELAVNARNILREEQRLGHEVENHGYQHVKFTKLLQKDGPEGVRKSLARTADIIMQETGRRPRFFRPPFWDYNSELEQVVVPFGYRMMKLGNPDINTLDYDDVANKRPHTVLVERLVKQVHDRTKSGMTDFILVVHERHLTVDALAVAIPQLQSEGYVFVRLDTLL